MKDIFIRGQGDRWPVMMTAICSLPKRSTNEVKKVTELSRGAKYGGRQISAESMLYPHCPYTW